MNYLVVDNTSLTKMMERVNDYISLGWLPEGGISIYREGVSGPNHFAQAVFKNTGQDGQVYSHYRVVAPRRKQRGRPRKAVVIDNSSNAP